MAPDQHRDSFDDPNWDAEKHAESVLTGRTVEDIAKGRPAQARAAMSIPPH